MNESKLSDAALAELLTLTIEVDIWGIYYYNGHGKLHRIHGPAIILSDGDVLWYQNDLLHRTDGPAVTHACGTKWWYLNGKRVTQKEFNERIKSV